MVCGVLFASAAAATEGPSRPVRQEAGPVAHLVQNLKSFLKAVWDQEGWQIDPLGRSSQGNGAGQDPAPTPDEGWQIDPWG
jgi:cell wall assembly regulator SMI1